MDGLVGYARQKSLNPTLLEHLHSLKDKKSLITIDGPAGSGKTTLAEEILNHFLNLDVNVVVIHMDDLYNGWGDALTETLSNRLLDIVSGFESGEISYPLFDWHLGKYRKIRTFTAPTILILEGVGSGQRCIREKTALSIWIDCDTDVALARVITRDGEQIRPFMNQWMIDQADHFTRENTQGAADYCIAGAP